MINQLQEDRKMMDDINWLRKKVEYLTSSMSVMKLQEETHVNPVGNMSPKKERPFIDASKFVEQMQFVELQRNLIKENDNTKRFCEEIKRFVDDLIECNKKKADEKDLKNLEEFLGGRIEEIKLNFLKKFADKTETVKNLKFLDTQLKFMMDNNNTKRDKGGENWLIAKRPIGGYECASCESYIGNLPNTQTNNQHVSWNKYPQRDVSDKAYRVKYLNISLNIILFLFYFI
jgi:hypothetical protein